MARDQNTRDLMIDLSAANHNLDLISSPTLGLHQHATVRDSPQPVVHLSFGFPSLYIEGRGMDFELSEALACHAPALPVSPRPAHTHLGVLCLLPLPDVGVTAV